MMVGGVAAAAAVRTFPFRVFSFPKEIGVSPQRFDPRANRLDLLALEHWKVAPIDPPEIYMHPAHLEAYQKLLSVAYSDPGPVYGEYLGITRTTPYLPPGTAYKIDTREINIREAKRLFPVKF